MINSPTSTSNDQTRSRVRGGQVGVGGGVVERGARSFQYFWKFDIFFFRPSTSQDISYYLSSWIENYIFRKQEWGMILLRSGPVEYLLIRCAMRGPVEYLLFKYITNCVYKMEYLVILCNIWGLAKYLLILCTIWGLVEYVKCEGWWNMQNVRTRGIFTDYIYNMRNVGI